jgi:excisionase family DNA binding protein
VIIANIAFMGCRMLANEVKTEIPISQPDRQEIVDLYNRIRAAEAKLIGPDGKAQLLPADLSAFLTRVLGELKAGKSVTILEDNAELTTMKAARMLAVSRQFLVQILEQGHIPFHKAGTHRRVYARDLLAYKVRRDAARRKALDELVLAEWEDGSYDAIPVNGSLLE